MLPRAHVGKKINLKCIHQLPHVWSEFPTSSVKAMKSKKINLPFDSIGHVQQIVQPKIKTHVFINFIKESFFEVDVFWQDDRKYFWCHNYSLLLHSSNSVYQVNPKMIMKDMIILGFTWGLTCWLNLFINIQPTQQETFSSYTSYWFHLTRLLPRYHTDVAAVKAGAALDNCRR